MTGREMENVQNVNVSDISPRKSLAANALLLDVFSAARLAARKNLAILDLFSEEGLLYFMSVLPVAAWPAMI